MKKRDEQAYVAQRLMFKDLISRRPTALFLFRLFDTDNHNLSGEHLAENEEGSKGG